MSRHHKSTLRVLQRSGEVSKPARFLLFSGACLFIVAVISIVGFRLLASKSDQFREEHWSSTIATVKDVRMRPVEQFDGTFGGAMLYESDVLASFTLEGSPQTQWITVSQRPERLAYAQLHSRLWKGKQYFVRWNPSNPKQIVIEIAGP